MGLADLLSPAPKFERLMTSEMTHGGNGDDDVGRFDEGEEAAYDYGGGWGNWRQVSIFSQFGLLLYLP